MTRTSRNVTAGLIVTLGLAGLGPTASADQTASSTVIPLNQDVARTRGQRLHEAKARRDQSQIWARRALDHTQSKVYYSLASTPQTCFESAWSMADRARDWGSRGLVTNMRYESGGSVDLVVRDYDGNGNLILHHETYHDGSFGYSVEQIVECAYDAHNRLILTTVRAGLSSPPPSEPDAVYRITYNGRSQPIGEVRDYDYDGDGITDRVTARYIYDDDHRLVREEFDGDNAANGTVDAISRVLITNDSRGRPVREVLEKDDNVDGIVDRRFSHDAEWDLWDNLLFQSDFDDYNADGVADSWSRLVYTYDGQKHLELEVYDLDFWGPRYTADGVIDYHVVTRHEYDQRGQRIHSQADVFFYDPDPDEAPNSRDENFYEYDDRGRLTRQVYRNDADANGTVDWSNTTTNTFGLNGRIVEIVFESQNFHLDTKRTTASYDLRGNLVTLSDVEFDDVGSTPQSSTTTFEYR